MVKRSLLAIFFVTIIATGLFSLAAFNIGKAQASDPSYIISGYVFDSSGVSVSGALAYLVNNRGSSFGTGYYSDPSGFYYLTAPAGTYRIVVRGLSGSNESYSESNIVLNSDIMKNITLVPGFRISGYITDSLGNRVAGASTNIYSSSWSVPKATADSSGYFSVYAPAGTYTFIIWPPSSSNLVNCQEVLTVTEDMTKNVTLASGFIISGYVRFSSGEAVQGVSVWVTNSSGRTFSSGRWSDSSGFYLLAAPAGTYTLKVRSLSGEGTSYSEANIVLNSDITKDIALASVSISPTSVIMDVGQTQQFNANASGGSDTYTVYMWYVDSVIKSTQTNSTFNYSPTSVGNYSITATAIDSTGMASSKSTVVSVTVNSALVAPNVSASNAMIDQIQTSVLNSTAVTTGTSPYSYQWYSKAPSNSSYLLINDATSPSYSFVTSDSTALGTWDFVLEVTDNATSPVTVTSESVSVTVNPTAVNPTPAVTSTPTVSPTSTPSATTSPSGTANPRQGPDTLTYMLLGIVVLLGVVLIATALIFIKSKK